MNNQLLQKSLEGTSLSELIRGICRRPNMYVGRVNFEMVAAFIEGYANSSEAKMQELLDFNQWIARKLEFSPNQPWWLGMEKKYSDVTEILEWLPKLFDEFLIGHETISSDRSKNA